MRKFYGVLLSICLFGAAPAIAGDLTLSNGQTSWHSTQCAKPNSPASILKADKETSGEDMNSLISQHNAFVDTAQAYMDCVSNEAAHDQSTVNQEIATSAEKTIGAMQAEIAQEAQAMKNHKR
jgi:hypothetical protein